MHTGSIDLYGCSPPPAILPRSPQLCQNGNLSVLSLISGWGMTVILFLARSILVKKKCDTVPCRDATASFIVTKVRDEVFEHFHAVAAKSHSSMWH
jgi:hypothetical protein